MTLRTPSQQRLELPSAPCGHDCRAGGSARIVVLACSSPGGPEGGTAGLTLLGFVLGTALRSGRCSPWAVLRDLLVQPPSEVAELYGDALLTGTGSEVSVLVVP